MKRLITCAAILGLIMAIAAIIPIQNPKLVNLDEKFLPLSYAHLLGTDNLGRDIFSLMVIGLQKTVAVLASAAATSLFCGCLIGTLGGYLGGRWRDFSHLVADLCMIVPSLIVALIAGMAFGHSPLSIGVALGIYGIGTFSYQSENLTRQIKAADFIKAEKLLGAPEHKIIAQHIVTHNLPPILALLGGQAGSCIASYASLTFIGLGADITQPDWGSMLYQYRFYHKCRKAPAFRHGDIRHIHRICVSN